MTHKPLMKLKGTRIENGLSQERIAAILGIHRNTYCERENGFTPFTHWEINRMLKLFKITYEELFLKEERRDYSNAKCR